MDLFVVHQNMTIVSDTDYNIKLFCSKYKYMGYNPRKTKYNEYEIDVIDNFGYLDTSIQTISWNKYEKL